jgi:hypothetical protein
MSALAILCACSLSVPAHDEIPKGRLGHPLGTYLTIEGVRFGVDKIGKAKIDAHTLLVDTIDGKKLDRPITISIETSASLPMRERCVFRGYESGRMVGVPDGVARAENLPLPAAVWHFHRYFIITSVVQPEGLGRSLEPMTPRPSPQVIPRASPQASPINPRPVVIPRRSPQRPTTR